MNGMSDFEKWLAEEIREIRKKVDANDEKVDTIHDKVAKVDKKLAVHQAKSGLFGAAGGAGIVGVRELLDYIKASIGA